MTIIQGESLTGSRSGLAGKIADAMSALATPAGPGVYTAGSIGQLQVNALAGALALALNTDNISPGQIGQASTPTYSASIPIVAGTSTLYTITPTDGSAFAIQVPTSATSGCKMTIRIKNTFGTLGALTFPGGAGGFRIGAVWTQPLNSFSRSITFMYDGAAWIETHRTIQDVSN